MAEGRSVAAQLVRVDEQEFREGLAAYIDAPTAVAVTRHGRTVGFYVPTSSHIQEQDILALQHAVEQLEELLIDRGVSEDDVVREFRLLQRASR